MVTEQLASKERTSAWDLHVALIGGENATVRELADRFYNSDHGNHMTTSQPLRYSQRYGYDRLTMEKDLGDDVNPIGHMSDLMQHLQLVVDAEYENGTLFLISQEDHAILAFVCAIHDIGETELPIVPHGRVYPLPSVGDIASGTKTAYDKAKEADVRRALYQLLYEDVDPTIIERAEAIIAHDATTIECNNDTHLHEIYETAHSLQTLATAKRVENVIFQDWLCCDKDDRAKSLRQMNGDVTTNPIKWIGNVGLHLIAAEKVVQTLPSEPRALPDCSRNPCQKLAAHITT